MRATAAVEQWNLLVLVDQFEELFRYRQAGSAEADEAEAFVNLLLASRAPTASRLHVTLTMRTDFLGHCVRFLELPEVINRAQYLTPRLSRSELESAIRKPARLFGGEVTPELTNELINSLAQDLDQLPVLQHLLARMWDLRSTPRGPAPQLDGRALTSVGGIASALSIHADEVFASLSSGEQSAAMLLFRSITVREGAGETARRLRRPQALGEIAKAVGCPWQTLVPIIQAFAQEGVNFLTHGEPFTPDAVVDISHEALILQWGHLRRWVDEEAESASQYRRWAERSLAMAEGDLLTGKELSRAVRWAQGTVEWRPTKEWAERYVTGPAATEFEQTINYIEASEIRERNLKDAAPTATEATEFEPPVAADAGPGLAGDVALCLSGGGYRAAGFHLGVLDLLERVGLLPRVRTLSTISGGTILGAAWALSRARRESFDAFHARAWKTLRSLNVVREAVARLCRLTATAARARRA